MLQENGLSLIAVIMHSPSGDIRFNEAQKLLNFGFSNFTSISFGDKGDTVGNLAVEKGVISSVDAVLSEDASFFIKKSKSSNVVQNISLNEHLEAPIEKGQTIGSVTYSLDNNTIKTINIVAKDEVKKLNLINMTMNIYGNWFNMMR